jgi:hypothetical protein
MVLRNLMLAIISTCLFFMQALAQKTNSSDLKPEDMGKMIEQQKKEIEADKDMDPDDKAMLLKMMNSKAVKEATKKMDHPDSKMRAAFQLDEKMTSLPKQDLKRLSTIPKKTFTTEQLSQYVNRLAEKIQSQLKTEDKSEAQNIISKAEISSSALSEAGVVAWYNGHPMQGLWIAAKSVQKADSVGALNNLGSMLIQTGYEEKAIPLLQYAFEKDSVNASVLNNLGRAWLGLGEKKKAKQFFLSCISHAPNHPEANNSLGCLYEAEGDKADAESSFEKSLKGAYNQNAAERLSILNPDYDLPKLIQFHYKAPKYFDQFGIEVPDECYGIDQIDSIKKVHEAFQNGLANLGNQYSAMEEQANNEMDAASGKMKKTLLNALDNGNAFRINIAPFELLAGNMIVKLSYNYLNEKQLARNDYNKNYQTLIDDYKISAGDISEKFEALLKTCVFEGEGGRNDVQKYARYSKEACDAQKKLADKTQNDAATLHTAFKIRYRRLILDYYNDFIYWAGMKTTYPGEANIEIYRFINDFIDELKYMSSTTPFLDGYGCDITHSDGTPPGTDEFGTKQKPECPFSLNIPMVIAKISVDCSSFSISGGEGITMGYKKDFANGQSTISIGAGVGVDVGVGAVHGGVKAGEAIYVTFNGGGQVSDVGLKMDVSGEVQVGAANTGASAGYTMGMNSGFNFTHSGLENSITL